MNEFKNSNQEELSEKLNRVSQEINPNPHFVHELEKQLSAAHKPKTAWFKPSTNSALPSLGWVALMIMVGLLLSWSIRNLIPKPQPAISDGTPGFVCPVTEPNGSTPPSQAPSPQYLGNGELWTVLWLEGKVIMSRENVESDGSFSVKWGWFRGVKGPLTITGRRLDGLADPLRADIPDGYGDTGFQVSGLIFPTTGCWEVTGSVGEASLTFVTEVIFSEPTPTPNIVIASTTTPNIVQNENNVSYDFRGGKLQLAVPLPASPAEANVYQIRQFQNATVEEARTLAERFGVQGNIYTALGRIPGTDDYIISDGKQSVRVSTSLYFTYIADVEKDYHYTGIKPSDQAESSIQAFLTAHGFDFPFRVFPSQEYNGYIVQPLAADGIPIQYESFSFPLIRMTLDENDQVLRMDASLLDYDTNPIGSYGLLSAEEALQKLLDENVYTGKMESMHSASVPAPQQWYREYPDNEVVIVYGYLTVNPAIDSGQPALIMIDGIPVTGNTSGMESLGDFSFIAANGQYTVENGLHQFQVLTWQKQSDPVYFVGSIRKEGDQIILTSKDGNNVGNENVLIDPPSDLPLDAKPGSEFAISGVLQNSGLFWTNIQYYETASHGGGGGGGGQGFYQLNLSGVPVPFPTPLPTPIISSGMYTVQENDTAATIAASHGISIRQLAQANNLGDSNTIYTGQTLYIPSPDEFSEQQVTDVRGFLSVVLHKKADGSEEKEYTLDIYEGSGFTSYPLEGENLSELDAYNGLPILVSGIQRTAGPMVTIEVESYIIPFPDLHFQILKGTQSASQIGGQTVILFTTEDGQSYVEFLSASQQPTDAYIGLQGDLIQQEVLIVPDETFGGMPVVHVYQSSVIDGANEMQVQANQIRVYDESTIPNMPSLNAPQNLIVESVELVYFVNNPYYQVNDPNYTQRSPYIQPVWRFHGHYDSGVEFDILIQALTQEFLLPELVPGTSPG